MGPSIAWFGGKTPQGLSALDGQTADAHPALRAIGNFLGRLVATPASTTRAFPAAAEELP